MKIDSYREISPDEEKQKAIYQALKFGDICEVAKHLFPRFKENSEEIVQKGLNL